MRRESWVIVLAAAIAVSIPLFRPDAFVVASDSLFHLGRIEGITECLRAGDWTARMHSTQLFGFGYPVGIFYPQLWLYIPAILCLAGISLGLSWNLWLIGVNFFTAFAAWYSFSHLLRSSRTGAYAAAIYVTFFYRIHDLYFRYAIGEVLAMAFIPLAALALYSILFRGKTEYWILLAVSFTGIFQSHILSAMFFVIFATIAFLCAVWKRRVTLLVFSYLAISVLVTVALNLWFYVPFWDMYNAYSFNIKNRAWMLFSDGWKLSWIVKSLLIFGYPYLWSLAILRREKIRLTAREKAFSFLSLIVGLALLLYASDFFPWRWLREIPCLQWFVNVQQFPWRIMCFAGFFGAIAGGIGAARFFRRKKYAAIVCAAFLLVFTGFPAWYFPRFLPSTVVTEHLEHDRELLGDLADYLHWGQSYEGVLDFFQRDSLVSIIGWNAMLTSHSYKNASIVFSYQSTESAVANISFLYYPHYVAEDENENTIKVIDRDNHRMFLVLSEGKHTIRVWFDEPKQWRIAMLISLATACVVGACAARRIFVP